MSLIDLQRAAAETGALKKLTEHVVTNQPTLLVVCGNEGNAVEEIWARQLGAWLYLPGVSQACNVQALCEEALPVAERISSRTPAPQR
jgi:hypothetical protein